jgi:RNA polymerase sigma factor (sigma-70 family)
VEPDAALVEPDERALVAALRRGEPGAFDAAYERYRGRIHAFLLRLSGSRCLADDLFQETFLRLARHAVRLEPDTRLGPWLFTVARNCYRSYRRFALLDRQRLHEYGLAPRPAGASPHDAAASSESAVRLEAALQDLPLKYREVLLLVGIEGMAPEEAAALLGLSAENLRQRLHRGRAMIKQRVAEADARGAAGRKAS